jgi:radical SAM protein with 4Fe4S-binding SPASM domain
MGVGSAMPSTLTDLTIIKKRADVNRSLPKRAATGLFGAVQNLLIYRPRMQELQVDIDRAPIFNSVFLETRTRCNGTCSFCAASIHTETRPDIQMSRALYESIIDQLSALSFRGILAPYVNSDSLLYPQVYELMTYARKRLPSAWLQVMTNGKALTVGKARQLVEAGIDELHINHYHDDFSSPLPERFISIRDELLPSMFPADRLRIGTEPPLSEAGERGTFVFNIVRRKETEVLTSRGGTSPNARTPSGPPRGFCEYPFTQLNITADGRVGQCCCDLYFSQDLGNVNDTPVVDLWFSQRFMRLRNHLVRNDRSQNLLCQQCDFCGVKKRPAAVTAALKFYRVVDGALGSPIETVRRLAFK